MGPSCRSHARGYAQIPALRTPGRSRDRLSCDNRLDPPFRRETDAAPGLDSSIQRRVSQIGQRQRELRVLGSEQVLIGAVALAGSAWCTQDEVATHQAGSRAGY